MGSKERITHGNEFLFLEYFLECQGTPQQQQKNRPTSFSYFIFCITSFQVQFPVAEPFSVRSIEKSLSEELYSGQGARQLRNNTE